MEFLQQFPWSFFCIYMNITSAMEFGNSFGNSVFCDFFLNFLRKIIGQSINNSAFFWIISAISLWFVCFNSCDNKFRISTANPQWISSVIPMRTPSTVCFWALWQFLWKFVRLLVWESFRKLLRQISWKLFRLFVFISKRFLSVLF